MVELTSWGTPTGPEMSILLQETGLHSVSSPCAIPGGEQFAASSVFVLSSKAK